MPTLPKLTSLSRQKVLTIAFVVIFAGCGVVALLLTHASTPTGSFETESGTVSGGSAATKTDTSASGGKAVMFNKTTTGTGCGQVSALLVPSCGAWLGASGDHTVSGVENQIAAHETRIGRQLDVVHTYHPVGSNTLSTADKYYINRANTILLTNYKPAAKWADAGGGNATTNAAIDSMATSIKSVAPKKIILILFHEPENDVSGGDAASCGANYNYKGTAGTPAQYIAMWQNVRNRFTALGVTNVVWGFAYMDGNFIKYENFECLEKDLWPGNNLVDWLFYEPYAEDADASWSTGIGSFYNWLEANSDATHDFDSKPWGLGEWGAWQTSQSSAYAMYDQAAAAMQSATANPFPRLKMYTAFDDAGASDSRTNYTLNGVLDNTEQTHYNAFANAPLMKQSH